jgi:hypothetical protein
MYFRAFNLRTLPIFVTVLLTLALAATVFGQGTPAAAPQAATRTPTETAKFVYQSLRAKQFREAFAVSVFGPAIEGMSDADFSELRPEFEAMSAGTEQIQYTGEEVTGDHATVFVQVPDDNGKPITSSLQFVKRNGIWLFGDEVTEKAVIKDGKNYFFNVRMDVHEDEAKDMIERIVKAEFVHASNNAGVYTDIKSLVGEELLPEDVLGNITTGYNYRVELGKDNKSYVAAAEPARYGRTGRLSFLVQDSILTKKDVGGKPLPRTKN